MSALPIAAPAHTPAPIPHLPVPDSVIVDSDMLTASGLPLWFSNPSRTPIVARDVLFPLGRINRYGGQFGPWSVLQHLALCVDLAVQRGFGPDLIALVAAHDLHEAYVGDLPTGLKKAVPGWRAIEDAWEAHVHHELGLPHPLPARERALVKAIDTRALAVEMRILRHPAADLLERRTGGATTERETVAAWQFQGWVVGANAAYVARALAEGGACWREL